MAVYSASQAISDLGNGVGYLYLVEPTSPNHTYPGSATWKILNSVVREFWENKRPHIEHPQAEGVRTNPVAGESFSVGVVQLTNAAADSCNSLVVSAGAQISGTVAMVSGDLEQSAQAIAAAVNSHVGSPDYRAVAAGDRIYLIAQVSGSGLNNDAVTIGFTGASTADTYNVGGGGDAGSPRFRFYLDAGYSSSPSPTTLASEAVDITDYLVYRGLNHSSVVVKAQVEAGNSLVIDRRASRMTVLVDGVQTAPPTNYNELNTVLSNGAQHGDVIHLQGDGSAATPAILKSRVSGSDNLYLNGDEDFTLEDNRDTITLIYSTVTNVGWVEVSRSSAPDVDPARARSSGIVVPATAGVHRLTVPVAGTRTIAAGNIGSPPSNTTYKNNVNLTGTQTLSGNLVIEVIPDALIEGDQGFISGHDSAITLNGNAINLTDGSTTLATVPEEMALSGGWVATWSYDGTDVSIKIQADFDGALTQFITNSMIKNADIDGSTKLVDLSVTTAKINDLAVTGGKIAANTIDASTKVTSGSVTVTELDADSNSFIITTFVFFESGWRNKVILGPLGFGWRVDEANYNVVKDIGATDDATVSVETDTLLLFVTGLSHTFPAGTAAGTGTGTLTATANNIFLATDFFSIVPTKTTANGGVVAVTLRCSKV